MAQIQIPILNKYLGFGCKCLVFFGKTMENYGKHGQETKAKLL